MKEARDGQYRHTRMASISRPDNNWVFDVSPPPIKHRPVVAGSSTSNPGVSSSTSTTSNNGGNSNGIINNGLGNGGASANPSAGNGAGGTSGDLLAPPHMSFLTGRRGKRHNVDVAAVTAAAAAAGAASTISTRGSNTSMRGSSGSNTNGSHPNSDLNISSPAGPSSVSSSTTSSSSSSMQNLLARKVTMHTGVNDLKAHVSSTLTSKITDSESGLKQQLENFSATLADLQALKTECGTLVAAFVAETETAEGDTQRRLKELKDEMANFSTLDGLEARIRKAHATIDERKTRLDELGVWVETREIQKRVWRKRVTTARRAVIYTLLVLALLFFMLRNFGYISGMISHGIFQREDEEEEDNTTLSILNGLAGIGGGGGNENNRVLRADLPLEDIVSCLNDIEHCQ
ncbi:hypothetical protein D0Z00_000818 [Geotrichum galactomycetum]|uniref:Uncharacterized protein n=1 Tax=Geotrichum galactomycetum TaxID=27317 RepID=A0ACB6V8Q1_9ASCO|nr:hypothetical protein D0Z00_000818 [Geotrichum candidum]